MSTHLPKLSLAIGLASLLAAVEPAAAQPALRAAPRPNILLCVSDDHSWRHLSGEGDPVVRTPNLDRLAAEGVRFTNAYCAAPTCAASRAAILTGQMPWRLADGALLFGRLSLKHQSFTHLLRDSGYKVGYTGKGYWPANLKSPGYHSEPIGTPFTRFKEDVPRYIGPTDYTANLTDFLQQRTADEPFLFWVGFHEPHRSFNKGIGAANGLSADRVHVPSFLPDCPEARSDLLDYYYEVEHIDRHMGQMIALLRERNELENTIIIYTSDNGFAFPRAKATLYDYGTRMPLLVRWGDRVQAGRSVDDLVSLTDLAPTLLELAGIAAPAEMTGRSITPQLLSATSGTIDPERDAAFTMSERHSWCRPAGACYPMRALRTREWLYIRNFEPTRWPAGDPPPFKPIFYERFGDIDDGPTINYMMSHREEPAVLKSLELATGLRPAEELYRVTDDPEQVRNLASESMHAETLAEMRDRLMSYLSETADPRAKGESPWEDMPFFFNRGSTTQPYNPAPKE